MKVLHSFRSFCAPSQLTGSCGYCKYSRSSTASAGCKESGNNGPVGCSTLKASFTVEASLIMAILLPLLITCLFMSEYLCDRTRAEAVLAEETTLLAAGEKVSVSGPAGFFFLNMEDRYVSNSAAKVQAKLESEEKIGIISVKTEAEAHLTKRKPVKLLRKLERVKALMKE